MQAYPSSAPAVIGGGDFFEPHYRLEKSPRLQYFLSVRVFKNTRFGRFAAREGISDDELKGIIDQLEAGQADADLGGGVFKVRVARSGAGKSGGYRVIVFFRSGDKTFFEYGFAKSALANISKKELRVLKRSAKDLFSFDDNAIKNELKNGRLIEI